jgi:hypothetical protein
LKGTLSRNLNLPCISNKPSRRPPPPIGDSSAAPEPVVVRARTSP